MYYRLVSRPEGDVAAFAAEELFRYLSAIDPTLAEGEGGMEITLAIGEGDPSSDAIDIEITNGRGSISAVNEGALLIAVYRFLYEIGCRWTHPGEGGESLPRRDFTASPVTVSVHEVPSYQHRGVCIEGALSEENAVEMIDFLPKVGMNSYFIQFFRPSVFFRRWYEHWQNYTLPRVDLSDADIDGIRDRLLDEIRRRGLRYHAVGHGWTCVPFGVPGDTWNPTPDEEANYPAEYLEICAEVDGERKPWKGVTLNTNLCYSRPDVRTAIANAVADYCEKTPDVRALHLWLADGSNNQCECEACAAARPSDYYVMLLNEVDEVLTARGLDTKVVFLTYVDLLWAPEHEVIKNPDRFLLMFAPVSRTYSKTIRESLVEEKDYVTAPYVRNKLAFPRPIGQNATHLREWQKTFPGSGFLFDYHLMWDHARDLGYMTVARTLFEDMKCLDLLGLDGMISCQLSRSAFPTGLPIYGMARALWDKNADFDAVADEYFAAEFGEKAAAVRAYLTEISKRLDPVYLRFETLEPTFERYEKAQADPKMAASAATVPALVDAFVAANAEMTAPPTEPWRALAVHAEYTRRLSRLVAARAAEDMEAAREIAKETHEYLATHEMDVQARMDIWNTMCVAVHRLKN